MQQPLNSPKKKSEQPKGFVNRLIRSFSSSFSSIRKSGRQSSAARGSSVATPEFPPHGYATEQWGSEVVVTSRRSEVEAAASRRSELDNPTRPKTRSATEDASERIEPAPVAAERPPVLASGARPPPGKDTQAAAHASASSSSSSAPQAVSLQASPPPAARPVHASAALPPASTNATTYAHNLQEANNPQEPANGVSESDVDNIGRASPRPSLVSNSSYLASQSIQIDPEPGFAGSPQTRSKTPGKKGGLTKGKLKKARDDEKSSRRMSSDEQVRASSNQPVVPLILPKQEEGAISSSLGVGSDELFSDLCSLAAASEDQSGLDTDAATRLPLKSKQSPSVLATTCVSGSEDEDVSRTVGVSDASISGQTQVTRAAGSLFPTQPETSSIEAVAMRPSTTESVKPEGVAKTKKKVRAKRKPLKTSVTLLDDDDFFLPTPVSVLTTDVPSETGPLLSDRSLELSLLANPASTTSALGTPAAEPAREARGTPAAEPPREALRMPAAELSREARGTSAAEPPSEALGTPVVDRSTTRSTASLAASFFSDSEEEEEAFVPSPAPKRISLRRRSTGRAEVPTVSWAEEPTKSCSSSALPTPTNDAAPATGFSSSSPPRRPPKGGAEVTRRMPPQRNFSIWDEDALEDEAASPSLRNMRTAILPEDGVISGDELLNAEASEAPLQRSSATSSPTRKRPSQVPPLSIPPHGEEEEARPQQPAPDSQQAMNPELHMNAARKAVGLTFAPDERIPVGSSEGAIVEITSSSSEDDMCPMMTTLSASRLEEDSDEEHPIGLDEVPKEQCSEGEGMSAARPRKGSLLNSADQDAEEEKAQTDGDGSFRGPSRGSRRSSKTEPGEPRRRASFRGLQLGRHLQWRPSRIETLLQSDLLTKAAEKVVDGQKSMHPQRARCGYQLLQRMKQLVEREHFDDTAGRNLIEKMFFDSIPRKHVEIKSIEQVLRVELLKRFLQKVADEVASIEGCWHGTQEKYVDKVLDIGLNPSLCATGAYGRGAYVGTHAGVAHQYADPNEEGWRHMCVILVVVGSSVVKGKEGEQSVATACDRLVNPTQYCFVEEDRLYCSHLITYRVLQMNNRRTGGGWEDPFQRKLASAVSKAARDRNKTGYR